MRQLLLILLAAFPVCFGYAQNNLVPNPSFEDYDTCPYAYYAQVNLAQSWSSFRESPDYAHACAGTVPTSPVGSTQNPVTGDAYCGFIGYAIYQNGNYREHIGAQLCEDLIVGQQYFASMNIIRSDAWPGACNNIGIRLSTIPFNSLSYNPLPNSAHVSSNAIITNDSAWTHVSGTFIADSAYKYIIIGNFFDSTATTQYGDGAYYFVDDVCLSTDSLGCSMQSCTALGTKNPGTVSPLTIAPNPAGERITLSTAALPDGPLTLVIYNTLGQMQQVNAPILVDGFLDVELESHLSGGVYFVEIQKDAKVIARGKFIKE